MENPRPTIQFGNLAVFFAIMALGFILRVVYFVGISGFDDVVYLVHVAEILDGSFSTEFVFNGNFPFRYRSGILFPTAVMYWLFGTSEYSAAIIPFVISMATIWLAWRAGQLFSPLVAAFSALLMATLPIAIVSASSLLPTLFSAFFCGLAIVLWIEIEGLHRPDSTYSGVASPLLSLHSAKYFFVGMSLGIAYLYRLESGVTGFVFIVFGLLWFKPNRGWLIAALGLALIIGAENTIYYSLHGEWFYRLKMISRGFAEVASLGGSGSPVPNAKSPMAYVNALFFKPTDMGLHGAAMVLAAVVSLFAIKKYKPIRPVLIWFWLWLLYLLFGTWSLESYVPTTKNPRYLQNICLPGVVLLASVVVYLIEQRGIARFVAWFGFIGVVCGSFVLLNPAWVYRYENASGGRVAAELIREQLVDRDEISNVLIQADYYTALNLTPFLFDATVTPISHADIAVADTGSLEIPVTGGFVIHDEFITNKYRDVVGYNVRSDVRNPPSNWKLIASRPRQNHQFQYTILSWLARLARGKIQGFDKSLKPGDLLLYEVEKS